MAEIASQSEAQEWYKIVTDWPGFWNNIQTNFQGLLAQSGFMQTQSPEMRAWYDSRVRDASTVYQRLYEVNQTVNIIKNAGDTFLSWVKGAVGVSSLGFLPAIPLAITAAGAAAAIYAGISWLKDRAEDSRTIEMLKEARAQGLSPQEAADLVKRGGSLTSGLGTLFGNIGKYLPWIIAGGIAIFVLPKLLRK